MIFQELSSEVMKIAIDAATNLTKAMYTHCKLDASWQDSNNSEYQDCTTEISQSNARIYGNLQAIEVFAANNVFSTLAIQKHLGGSMENVKIGPHGSDGLEIAIVFDFTSNFLHIIII